MMFFQVLFLFYFIATSIGDVSKNETNTANLNQTLNVTQNITQTLKINPQVSEGGGNPINVNHVNKDTTHMGREHIINDNNQNLGDVKKPDSNEMFFETPEKNDNRKSVPKKGVTLSVDDNISTTTPTTSTTTTTTTPKPIKKKPLITEAGDEIPFAPSNFNPKITNNETNNHKIPNLDEHGEKVRQADYIVPIVAVILSVPLVAIILSVLYKRGAEWWQHRHYRRMDFLIEGMYNN